MISKNLLIRYSSFNNEDFNASARVFNGCEFSNIDFSDKDVMNVDFIGCKFNNCLFTNTNFVRCYFKKCHIVNSKMLNTDLSNNSFDPRFIRDVVEEYLANDKLYASAKIKEL